MSRGVRADRVQEIAQTACGTLPLKGRRDIPDVARRILDAAAAIAPLLVIYRINYDGPAGQCSSECGIRIRYINV